MEDQLTVAELRALLETLPERFDDTEVLMYTTRGLCHIESVELDRRKGHGEFLEERFGPIDPDRLRRKVRLRAMSYWQRPHLWYEGAPEWRLKGWWPKEAAEIGLEVPS